MDLNYTQQARRTHAHECGSRHIGPRSPKPDTAALDARNRALVAAHRAGDPRALDRLLRENEALLVVIAHAAARGARARAWFEELLQELRLVLVDAARTFDPDKGVRFSSWVGQCARPTAQRLLAQVALPAAVPHDVYGAAFLGHEFADPGPVERVLAARALRYKLTITEAPVTGTGVHPPGVIPADLLPPRAAEQEAVVARGEAGSALAAAFTVLTPRDADVVLRRVIDDEDLHVIGETQERPITRERVRQVVQESLPKLRSALERMGFRGADGAGG